MDTQAEVIAWLAEQNIEAYLVGGCVRDRLLGRPVYDLDLAVAANGLRLARRLADRFRGAYYALDEARSTGRAILPAGEGRLIVDVARLRGEDRPPDDGRAAPEGSLAADLADRDFTVNALAAHVVAPDEIIDLHGGMADLQARLIRPVSEASIRRDPLRALRAVRLAAQLGFELAPETVAVLRRDGPALARVSGERLRDELAKLLALPAGGQWLALLDELGLLTVLLPELEPLRGLAQPLPHHMDVLLHSLEAVRALEAVLDVLSETGREPPAVYTARLAPYAARLAPYAGRLRSHLAQESGEARPRLVMLKLAALLHDVGKAQARRVDDEGRLRFIDHDRLGSAMVGVVLRRLRLNVPEIRLAETIVRHHMRPLLLAAQDGVSARAVYRFFRDTGSAGLDILLHSLADHLATYPAERDTLGPGDPGPRLLAVVERMLADYWAAGGERVSPPRLIDGRDLQRELGLQPGPRIGELLEAVREAQVAGDVRTREQALALVRRLVG